MLQLTRRSTPCGHHSLSPRRTRVRGRSSVLQVQCVDTQSPVSPDPNGPPQASAGLSSPDAAAASISFTAVVVGAPTVARSALASSIAAPSAPAPAAPTSASTPSSPAAPSNSPTVADLDARRFKLHPSCGAWAQRPYRLTTAISNHQDGPRMPGPSLADVARQVQPPSPLADPRRAAHWWYHLGRQVFFLTQSFAGFAAHHVSELLLAARGAGINDTARNRPVGHSGGGGGGSGSAAAGRSRSTPLERLLEDAEPEVASRLIDGQAIVDQDYDNIRAGCYPMPWDMVTPGHRQYSPLYALRGSFGHLREWTAITRRRVHGAPEPVWLSGPMYPQYYTKTYHYQTDGWMSDRSAALYEFGTETLFTGLQDAMQRTSLMPVSEYLREAELGGRGAAGMRLLEVAAGTGRFHTFIKDAHPALPSVVSDLSPFYLARARDNLDYWAATRQRQGQGQGRLGGVDGTGVTEFLQTAAESLDAADGSFDILVCVYLFHELPEPVRRAAAGEFFRVLRPGGLLVITDSVQTGDRPGLEGTLDVFGDWNEPYYRNYISCNLGAMFEAAGFQCDTKYLCAVTKTLSFRKPL